MPPHFEAFMIGWGALCLAVGVLSGIAMSRGAKIVELRDFWRRGYAHARREQAWRAGWDQYVKDLGPPDRDAMAEPFGDVTLVPEAPRHG